MLLMTVKVIQCNLNRSRPALDLLMQYVLEEDIAICIVSELPKLRCPSTQWAISEDGLTGVYHRPEISGSLMIPRDSSSGIAVADIGEITFVACYLPPNIDRTRALEFFDHLSDVTDMTRKSVVIAGDFNSKSPMWGSAGFNWRGHLLEEWLAERDLCVLNAGNTPTCVRPQGSSIINITISTARIFTSISSWKVITDVVTLSDHRYIYFEIVNSIFSVYNVNRSRCSNTVYNVNKSSTVHNVNKTSCTNIASHNTPQLPGWSWKTLNEDDFNTALEWYAPEINDLLLLNVLDANAISTRIKQILADAADFSAKRRRKDSRKSKSTYWWNDTIASLRASVLQNRRRWTRYRTRRDRGNADFDDERLEFLEKEYKMSKMDLRNSISSAKAQAWSELLLLINEDPWGLPYKIVTGKLRKASPSLTELVDSPTRETILSKLFPPGQTHNPDMLWHNFRWDDQWSISPDEIRYEFQKRPLKGAAPGPDGIPDRAMRLLPDCFLDSLVSFYNKCIKDGIFPVEWKIGRLVLIPKQGGAADGDIPKTRPICVLDELGKTFERIICKKINMWLHDNQCYALSDNQFGFVEGRSTTDAICRVINTIEEAFSHDLFVVAISLDIENAFNSLPWTTIKQALKDKRVPDFLRRIIDSYLYNRSILYPTKEGLESRIIQSGVPQGSVLGPLLWNIGYDSVLHKPLEEHSCLTCYADDTLLLTAAEDIPTALSRASLQVHILLNQIRKLGLKVATHKTEVMILSRKPCNEHNSVFIVDNDSVNIVDSFKYLGIILDRKLTFIPHFEYAIAKSSKMMGALSGLMPNLRGPCEAKRKLYGNVVLSVLLYGAPVWCSYLRKSVKMRTRMNQSMRLVCNRICSGYRTISLDAATLLARLPPVTLLVECRRRIYERVRDLRQYGEYSDRNAEIVSKEENLLMMRQWKIQLDNSKYGTRTISAILPSFGRWIDRQHGGLDFHLTQILTGHGCFGAYLDRIQKADHPMCMACNEGIIDSVKHTVSQCSRWVDERHALINTIGGDLRLEVIIDSMLELKEKWVAFSTFCRRIMLTKENEERSRQALRSRSRSLMIRSSTDDT